MEAERLEPLDAARMALAWERVRRVEAELAHAKSELGHLMPAFATKYSLEAADVVNTDGTITRATPPARASRCADLWHARGRGPETNCPSCPDQEPKSRTNGEAGKTASPS